MNRLPRLADHALAHKFLALVLLGAAAPTGVALLISGDAARTAAWEAEHALLASHADHLVVEMNAFHRRHRTLALYLASVSREHLRGSPSDEATGFAAAMAPLLATGEDLRAGLLATPDGRVIGSSDPLAVGSDVSDRDYFKHALAGEVFVTDMFLRLPMGEAGPLIGYAAPVRGAGGQILGVVALFVRGRGLWTLVRESKDRAGRGSYAVLYDRHGVRVAHAAREDLRFRPAGRLPPAEIAAMVAEARFGHQTRELLDAPVPVPHEFALARRPGLDDEGAVRTRPGPDADWTLSLARRLDEVPWTVFMVVPEAVVFAPAGFERLLGRSLLGAAVALVFCLLAAAWFTRGLGRRIGAIAAAAQAMGRGALDLRLPGDSADELGALAARFNEMAASLLAARTEAQSRLRGRTTELEQVGHELAARRAELNLLRAELQGKQRELERKTEEVRNADRIKSDFLANVSHELRTPLNAIIGFSELLIDETEATLSRRHGQYLNDVLASGRHLLAVINDILDLSKIEAGYVALERQPVDPADVIGDACQRLGPAADKREITVAISDRATRHVSADRAKLVQVLLNLVSNAIKFGPPRSRVDVSSEDLEGFVRFSIEDRGPGIDEALRTRLFQPFVQGESPLVKRHQGTGLGLAICQRLCQLHGGRIEVESRPGGGASFRVLMPIDASVPAYAGRRRSTGTPARAPASELPARRATVLVIDDNDLNRELIRSVLERRGKKVLQARDGEEGVQMARRELPDIVLMDLAMPKKDGFAATRELRAHPATHAIPIVALTALAVPADEERARAAGVDEYLTKPIDRKRLEETIERLIAQRRVAS